MRFTLNLSVMAAAAGLLGACAGTSSVAIVPTAVVHYDRQGCPTQPDLGAALSLTPEKEKAAHTVTTPVRAGSGCLTWAGKATPYVVYALPADVEDKTFDVGASLESQRIFAPEVTVLDGQGAPTRTFARDQFLYRGGVYSVQFRARPGDAYVLVTAAPELVGKAYESIAIGTTTTTAYTGAGSASWTVGNDSAQSRTFSYEGVAQVSVFDSDTKEAAKKPG
ncbi:MalM family protein [Caulobacter sp. 17J80-11]|uniref:MalM family protein n=1 Tax=Caulobacter sp. 17J80-11 TaxID=2763502 RepID=UPI0016536A42|nr:hypothetical protein [Caulobacter sp. 17J80-11]